MRTILFSFLILSFSQINISLGNCSKARDTSKVGQTIEGPALTIVEQMPIFSGGEEAMYNWLAENIKYPQVAKETGITGTVIVSFIVERDGSISNITIRKDIGGGCGEEAVRVVKLMPKWKPGKQKGAPVRVQYNLPIRFSLN